MSLPLLFAIDVVAIGLLVFGLYFPRHRRKDLVAAYLGVNIGVLAVADALSSSDIGAGLGIGLFGVLSIIRLRSTELDQEEVAYYFASLALGLLGGLAVGPDWLTPVLMASVVAALYIGDHPKLFAGYRTQVVNLGVAITNERELIARLERLLGATVYRVKVRKVDLVNETTNVEVRYRIDDAAALPSHEALRAGSGAR